MAETQDTQAQDTSFLDKYRAAPPADSDTSFLDKYVVKQDTDKTFHSNPLAKEQWTQLSPEKQKQRDLMEPAAHTTIPKPVQYGMEAIPMLTGAGEAIEAGGGLPTVASAIGRKVIRPAVTGAVGSMAGGWLGREVGGLFGHPGAGKPSEV